MTQNLDDNLVKKFPALYKNRHGKTTDTCMCWGFPADGWYDLIYSLSKTIENILLEYPGSSVVAEQVKEKFGGLRFYYRVEASPKATSEDIAVLEAAIQGSVAVAETMSYHICEMCGNKGNLNKKGWLTTLCEVCRDR